MGRGGKYHGQWEHDRAADQAGWYSGSGYGGKAGKERWPNPSKPRSQGERTKFPSFATMDIGDAETTAPASSSWEVDQPKKGRLVNGLQGIVTKARKAEIKVRKTEEERVNMEKRWNKFQDELQAHFVKERAHFEKEMARLAVELEANQEAQYKAYQDLQELIANPAMLTDKMEVEPIPEEANAAWEELINSCEARPEQRTELLAVQLGQELQQLMQSREQRQARPATRPTETPAPEATDGARGPMPSLDRFMADAESTAQYHCVYTRDQAGSPKGPLSSLALYQESDDFTSDEDQEQRGIGGTASLPVPGRKPRKGTQAGTGLDIGCPLGGEAGGGRPERPGYGRGRRHWRGQEGCDGEQRGELAVLCPVRAGVRGQERTGDSEDETSCHGGSFEILPASSGTHIMTVVDGQWRPGKQPQQWNYETAELFRPVSAPSLGVLPLWLSSPWHGPAGGHDQNYNYEAAVTVFFDIFDVLSWFGDVFEKLFDGHAEKLGATLQAFFLTLQLVHLLAGGLFVYSGWRGRAPLRSGNKAAQHPTLRVLLAFGLISVAFGAPSPPAARCTFYNLGRPPEATDIELWASGQLTMREELARATADLARSRPLMHSSDEAPVTHLERAWEQTDLIEGDLVGDVARATHISVWVGTPSWEPETVDIGIGFPLTSQRLCDAVRSSCSFTPDYAESVLPTTPQLSDLFGSCIAIPAWAPAAGRYAFVLDCQGIGGTVYVVYMQLPLTRAALLRHVPEEDQTDVVFIASVSSPSYRASTRPLFREASSRSSMRALTVFGQALLSPDSSTRQPGTLGYITRRSSRWQLCCISEPGGPACL